MSLQIFVAVTFCFAAGFAAASIVVKKHDFEVRNGGTLLIHKSHLQFATVPGEVCKVQVVENEPIYQRVGEFTPKVFDCDYLANSVRYQHYGSPLLSNDVVKLRVSRLLDTRTIQETLLLRISILDSECDVIKVGGKELRVLRMNGVSNPITKDVLQFNYDRLFRNKCEVRVHAENFHFPEIGELVVRAETPVEDREFEPIGTTVMSCDDFVLKGFRYQHLAPPTPNIDYIPLHVIITDKKSRYILKQEYHWLPVKIDEAFENQPPHPSYSNMNVLEVNQFVTTNLLSSTISATDSETESGKLVFNITKQPEQGFIAHLDDESKPVESFLQKDIAELKIVYQPPNATFSERQTFIAEFLVYDTRFAKSQIIQVLLSIRISHTLAPRISWNMGLTMLEGQSRMINNDCLQLVDSDAMHLVRITLAGGLQHGHLYVNERRGYSFSWAEIENDNVKYQHDDSDTTRDHIMFQVSDGFHSSRFKLPIEILPKDDSPPTLINNVLFEVAEGQVIQLYTFLLEAYDGDSSSDYIKFNITRGPTAGKIQKRKAGERIGWDVQKFEQKDIYEGNIIYQHLGDEVFEDGFDFVLIDGAKPVPNVSPLYTATIKITPIDDNPPRAVADITRSLIVNETDVALLTTDMLEYIDEESPGSVLTYILTSDVENLESELYNKSDAGHLFYTDDMVMLMKSPAVPHLKMFSQDAVDHNKVAYMPPIKDIGLYPLDVQFEYSISDSHGTKATREQFVITVLPVDNQPPHLRISPLSLREGESVVLSEEDFEVSDYDTVVMLLEYIVRKAPIHGRLELQGQQLSEGDSFQYMDIKEFGILYTHDGTEQFLDSFDLVATDGNQHSKLAVATVIIQPIDDEPPVFGKSNDLFVNESSSATILSKHLQATDLDTDDQKLIFQIVAPPRYGHIKVESRNADSFTQREIFNGQVIYQHNGDEIGHEPKYDVVALVVMDKELSYDKLHHRDSPMAVLDFNVTILPINNRPPNIVLGSAIFYCDEGGRHALTTEHIWATDLDTPQDKLVFKISSPKYGMVEDQTPREGYEKQIAVPVTSFTLKRLADGNIFYVQSLHQGIEPTADTFVVSVTDGKHASAEVPFLIAIIPTNDEPPNVHASNFSCGEGDMLSFSDGILNVIDLDVPSNEIMISVTSPPTYGRLIDEIKMSPVKASRKRNADYSYLIDKMEHISEFSLRDWSQHLVQPAYLHDGTENSYDKFELKISDGKHAYNTKMSVNIVMVNDEKPSVITNKGMTLEVGESQVLNNVVLFANDADSPDDELFYILYSTPSQGKLQIKSENGWRTLQSGDSFAEQDVADNLIQYIHTNLLSTKSKDFFRFSLTDGTWTTRREKFDITIRYKKKTTVHIVTGIAKVKEGDQVFITTDILSTRDGFNRPDNISYEVVAFPMYGQIEHTANPFDTISMFSQVDLMSGKIIYRHQSKGAAVLDLFTIKAGNGIQHREGVVTVQIEPVDDILPSLDFFPLSSSDGGDLHLVAFRGTSITINEKIITITDPDTAKDHLQLIIISHPEHGNLLLGHEILMKSVSHGILQSQLENGEFMYEHNGDDSQIDRFSFIVTDGAHSGYLINGKRMLDPTVFHISIEQLDDQPPKVTVNIPTTSVEPLSSRQYAVYIDSHYLTAIDEPSEIDDGIVFSVTEPPSFGILKKVGENSKLALVSEFTMRDLKMRRLAYVIAGKVNVTDDSFAFDVQDDWGNIGMGHRFEMSWSRIELVGKSLKVCENQNQSSISLKRYGQMSSSSFVGVKIVSFNSAEENRDFVPNMARQIQFDPETSLQDWSFRLRNDGIRERKEKFKILVHSPVNAVLEPRRIDFSVFILDAGSSYCRASGNLSAMDYSAMKKKKNRRRKTMSRRKSNKKGRDRKAKDIVGDQSGRSGSLKLTERKYGKFGKGITVPPSTYFRNDTHRIWQYHGIIPITVDEESIPKEKESFEDFELSLDYEPDEELFNDASHQVPTSQSALRSVSRLCTIHVFDHLYYDPIAGSLMRCNGAVWIPWSPMRTEATSPINPPSCGDGWHEFESKCYYISTGDMAGESWNSAQRQCREDHNAHLAAISSKKHMNWVRRKSGRHKLWIGLNRKISEDWEWTVAENVNFTNWKRGMGRQRRRSRMPRHEANCALSTERKRWIPKSCTISLPNTGFICMKDLA